MDTKIPNWDQYFIAIARTVATRSKDPNTKVGAVLVDSDYRIIGTGFNGMPSDFIETPELWKSPDKYDYVVHAEVNCLLHAVRNIRTAWLYTTMYPCKECAKLIAAAGIHRVVYSDDKYKNPVSEAILKGSHIHVARVK